MTKLFYLIKFALGILGTFFIIQIIIGLPLILIFKIDILGKEVTRSLILINIFTELVVIWFYLYKYKYYDRLLVNLKHIYISRLIFGTLLSIIIPLLLYFILYKYNDGKFLNATTNASYQIGYLIAMLILATFEELLCRFILLEKFNELNSKFISIIISSLFF